MKSFIIIGAAFVACAFAASTGEFSAETTQLGNNEEDVVITDSEGNVVSIINVFPNFGIELEKPTNRKVCLIKNITHTNKCFDESPVTAEMPEIVMEKCKGRQLLDLSPIECDAAPVGSESGGRSKRSTWGTDCRWTYTESWPCVDWACDSMWMGVCWLYWHCEQEGYERIWTRQCVEGYSSSFK